ncbi:MAG TPA: response regulator [Bryobacteraceae bacterium]
MRRMLRHVARFSLQFEQTIAQAMQRSASFRLWTSREFAVVEPPVTVLIIDDDLNAADALAHVLEAHGLEVRTASGGVQAVKSTQQWTPAVIILDIEMPQADGFKVARALRTSRRFEVIPIVAHTSLPEREVLDRGSSAQIDAYCRKGKSTQSLLKLIELVAPTDVASCPKKQDAIRPPRT